MHAIHSSESPLHLDYYTIVIPFYNEAARLPLLLESIRFAKNVLGVDAGSTDHSTSLFASYGRPWITILNQQGLPTSPEWYQQIFRNVHTDYILMNFCGYVYPKATLEYIGRVASERKAKIVLIRAIYYYYGKSVWTSLPFDNYIFCLKLKISSLFFPSRVVPIASHFFNKHEIDWSYFRIHHECPVPIKCSRVFSEVRASLNLSVLYSRNVCSDSLEIKHAKYASADGASSRLQSGLLLVLIMIFSYPYHLITRWFLTGNIFRGIPAFIDAHYWASFHTSKHIRTWERRNNYSSNIEAYLSNERIIEGFLKAQVNLKKP